MTYRMMTAAGAVVLGLSLASTASAQNMQPGMGGGMRQGGQMQQGGMEQGGMQQGGMRSQKMMKKKSMMKKKKGM